jgi:hypothetical protein
MNDKLKELLTEYRSLLRIPDSELEKIGKKKVRTQNLDGGFSYTIKDVNWEENKKTLFGEIDWEAHFSQGIRTEPQTATRLLDYIHQNKLYDMADILERLNDNLPEDTPLSQFRELIFQHSNENYNTAEKELIFELAEISEDKWYDTPEFKESREIINYGEIHSCWNTCHTAYHHLNKVEEKLRYFLADYHDEQLSFEKTGKDVANILEKILAQLNDSPLNKQTFEERCNAEIKGKISGDLNLLEQQNIRDMVHHDTLCSAKIKIASEVLYANGFEEISTKILNFETMEECADYLRNCKNDVLPSFQEREELKKEPRKNSVRLKELKKQFKQEKQVIEGARDFFEPYLVASEVLSKPAKDMLNILIANKKAYSTTWTIDSTQDEEKDADPGRASGDCTAGRPLPFYHPDLHNLKVYEGKEHIGNMYLFVTEQDESETEKDVWHLDAIQIPKRANWEKTIETLVDSLSEEAKKQNVNMITVNSRLPLISNYDYIAKAVRGYKGGITKTAAIELSLDVDSDQFSEFQGRQDIQRILWQDTIPQ